MRSLSYHLGENMYRRTRRRRLIRGFAALTVVAMTAFAGFTGFNVLRHDNASQSEISHRGSKVRTNGQAKTISDRSRAYARAQWLRVERVRSSVPSAAPSRTVTVQSSESSSNEPPKDTVTVTIDGQTETSPAPETTPTTTTKEPETVPKPDNTPEPEAKVVPPAPNPEVVVTTPTKLPQIQLPAVSTADLSSPEKKDIAMQLVSSAENSSLDWKDQYGYLEDIDDGRGYTGGIIGFTSGTHDMLELVEHYTKLKPTNPLAEYVPALEDVDGSDSHAGLGSGFEKAWKQAASDPVFQKAQNDERDRVYFNPAVAQAKKDGLKALGQFIYYDAMVMHGPGDDSESFGGIREAALKKAKTPAQGGTEAAYLDAFLDARVDAMKQEAAHEDVSRVETAQRKFLEAGNFNLNAPLSWKVYGDPFSIQ